MSTTVPINKPEDMSDSQRRLIMSMAINDLQTKVSKHHEVLITGNGEVSLLERIRKLEEFVQEFRYWSKFLFGALIVQTLTFFGAVVLAVVRFLPVLERLAQKP